MTRYCTGLRSWNSSTSSTSHRARISSAAGDFSSSSAALTTSVSKSTTLRLGEEPLVADEDLRVVGVELIAAEAVHGESRQQLPMPLRVPVEAPQDDALILLVGDAEPAPELHVRPVLAQQLGAERVDRASLDTFAARAELAREPRRDLVGGLVRERERADARGLDAQLLDEIADALDEAERLPGAGPREHEGWSGRCLDGLALRLRRDVRRQRERQRGASDLGDGHAPNLVAGRLSDEPFQRLVARKVAGASLGKEA